MSGYAEVGLDEHATGAVNGNAQLSAQRRSGHTRRPQDHGGCNLFVADPNRAGLNAVDHVGGANLYSEALQLVLGFAGKFFGIGWENPGSAFDEQDAGLLRVDVAKLAVHCVTCDLSQSAGEFDAGGAASDDCKLQRRSALAGGLIRMIVLMIILMLVLMRLLTLGQFEGQENATSDFERIFDRLETGGQRLPLFVTEVGVGCPGGDDQKVVIEHLLFRDDFLLFQVEIEDFFKQHLNVGVASQYPADGRRYFAGREAGGRDLVEQRLEGVMIFPVNDCDLNGEAGDAAGGGEASETGAHDHHSRYGFAFYLHLSVICRERLSF